MSASRVTVELSPDEYVQLLDEADRRSPAGSPSYVPQSPETREYHHAEDSDAEEHSFAASSNVAEQSPAGAADERAELASAAPGAFDADPVDQHRDPDPHFDKLATENATAQPLSGLPGSASIDTPPIRRARRGVPPARRRTRDGKAPRRWRRRWIIITSSAVPVVVLALVLESASQPTAVNSARTTTAVSKLALTTFGGLVTSATQDIAVVGRHAEAGIETQAARALLQRRIAQRRHQRARPPRAQQPRTTATRRVSVQASQVSTPSIATVAAQSTPAAQPNPPTSSPSTSTYTHQQAGPTSLGSQVGSNCDPTCR
jgi:hypothetical protein